MIDPDDYLQSLAEAFWNEHSDKERVKYVRLKRAPAPKDVSSATWLHFGELGLWRVKRNRLWRLGRQHGSVIRAALAAGELIDTAIFVITLRAETHEVPAVIRLRAALKRLLREHRLQCLKDSRGAVAPRKGAVMIRRERDLRRLARRYGLTLKPSNGGHWLMRDAVGRLITTVPWSPGDRRYPVLADRDIAAPCGNSRSSIRRADHDRDV